MAKKRPGGARNEMIHCEFCGEDYAATYKRCPFCDGRPLEEGEGTEEGGRRAGGRRLATNTRGGGYGGRPGGFGGFGGGRTGGFGGFGGGGSRGGGAGRR